MANHNRRNKTSQPSINNSRKLKKVVEMTQCELWNELLSHARPRNRDRLKTHLKSWIKTFIGN